MLFLSLFSLFPRSTVDSIGRTLNHASTEKQAVSFEVLAVVYQEPFRKRFCCCTVLCHYTVLLPSRDSKSRVGITKYCSTVYHYCTTSTVQEKERRKRLQKRGSRCTVP